MWFTETPWPPILVFSVVGVICVVAWTSRKQLISLGVLALMVICCVVTYAVEQQIVTEREKVEVVVHDLAATVKSLNMQESLAFVSDTAPEIKVDVRIGLGMVQKIDRLAISDLQIEMKLKNSRATTHFRANGTWSVKGYGNVGHAATRWRLTWQRESDKWKIIKVERLHPMNGRVIDFTEAT